MQATSRVVLLGSVLLALASVLTACGSSDDAGPTAEVPATSPPSVEVSLFEKLLGAIPDAPDTRKSVLINDYAAVREILQLSPASPDAKFPALLEYAIQSVGQSSNGIKIHMGTGPFISGMHERAFEDTKREYLAFDGRNVDQSVEAGIAPSIFEVVWGRFDPARTGRLERRPRAVFSPRGRPCSISNDAWRRSRKHVEVASLLVDSDSPDSP